MPPAPDPPAPAGEAASDRERRRAATIGPVPRWYHPGLHLAIPAVLGLGAMAAALSQLRSPSWRDALVVPVTLFAAFGFEWRAHKSILHLRLPLLGGLYVRHELRHHVVFVHEDMPMRDPREARLVLMPAYAVVLVFAMVVPIGLLTARLVSRDAALLQVATSMVFFLSYEWLHYAYHLPPGHPVGGLSLIARLREQHRRHHDPRLMKRWNFNVTLPLFDWLYRSTWSPEREAEETRKRAERRGRQGAGGRGDGAKVELEGAVAGPTKPA